MTYRRASKKSVEELIKKCDEAFYKELCCVADALWGACDGGKNIRIICLSGPTCSGKTTAAVMLADRFDDYGRRVVTVSIDDFYYDREYLDRVAVMNNKGGIDYDSVDTIDLPALKLFVEELFTKGGATCPVFNFKTGNRSGGKEISADGNTVVIFEGIQAIYPQITSLLEPYGVASVYIAPLSSIDVGACKVEPNVIRLMRRIVRDSNFRNASADFTMALWKSVRQNEDRHIFPYVDRCTYRIDSTHQYEIGVLKPYLERLLTGIPRDSENYRTAQELLGIIREVEAIDASLIGENSLYKEFV